MTLVDTNIWLDLFTDDPDWAQWSIEQLNAASLRGALVINDVIYAELSVRFARIEDLDAILSGAGAVLKEMPRSALFLAGKAFQRYRAVGGPRTGVLPDFFIGANCAVTGMPLLTRDIARYRTHFPTVELIAPEA